jgi:O-methyltransferase involved in polyketide biosynthesis
VQFVASRRKQCDLWTTQFPEDHPDAMVLHLRCGLNPRVFRLDPSPSVHWFDVDVPKVIELRQRLCPEGAGYVMIGSSVNVPEDHPGWIAAEAVRIYLSEDIMNQLIKPPVQVPRT